MERYTKLNEAGLDVEALVKRLMGNEALVRVFVKKFIEDDNFGKLRAAMAAGDCKEAEMASHTLKGMCGNMSLTELYELFSEQVLMLRRDECLEAQALMERIIPTYEDTVTYMTAWLEG